MVQKIRAIMFIEVAGRPAEHVKNSLEAHVQKIGQVKDVKLVSCKLADPKKVDTGEDLHTCFAEVEVELLGLAKLMDLVFDFMPSSIEIIDPEYLEMDCQEATMFANDLAGRLHGYDNVAKMANMQVQQMAQKLQQIQQASQPRPAPSPYQPLQITMSEPEKKVEQKRSESQKEKSSKNKKSKKKK